MSAEPAIYPYSDDYNQISRSVTSHPYLQIIKSNEGWYTTYEKFLFAQYNDINLEKLCPTCPAALIRGLDHSVFSAPQHDSIIELLQLLGITSHNFDLFTIVLLTQKKGHNRLTLAQQQEAQNWLVPEGQVVEETHDNDRDMKHKVVEILRSSSMYQTLVPSRSDKDPFDHTLLLGGSIQQMQMRFLGMVAFYDNYSMSEEQAVEKPNHQFSRKMGDITALTCNRVVNTGYQKGYELEVDKRHSTIWFEIDKEGMVYISENEKSHVSDLTEDTAYKAIVYAVNLMCQDYNFFNNHRRSKLGFHPQGHFPEHGLANYLYRKNEYDYELTDDFYRASCQFLEEYSGHLFTYMTPKQASGVSEKIRPTTKQTVREWVKAISPCKGVRKCNILTVSNQPNARYQQVAVMQSIEENLLNLHSTRIKVDITAFGASTQIPTDEVLDNLSRTLFMIHKRPVR
ncbi:hypothetical protein NX722_21405 [Endozoicomonas gorgoniicola]|uniref:Uncharacterized protein n=1 Tax=Endozoicomonas gorgoniicola TaxID=1234144 RepID=A0ABT3N1R6_9GAMM|nr:hypothetical protein [Endozoicomonas gorgoniicola]MCW7555134.1 hypothetical protein [Endozoicomonas gorgoniicola]